MSTGDPGRLRPSSRPRNVPHAPRSERRSAPSSTPAARPVTRGAKVLGRHVDQLPMTATGKVHKLTLRQTYKDYHVKPEGQTR